MRAMPDSSARTMCPALLDPQSVEIAVSSLPASTAAGTAVSTLFEGSGFIVPVPVTPYAGAAWSRSGRAAVAAANIPQMPLVPGIPLALGRDREIYLRQSATATVEGTFALLFFPYPPELLDDPFLLAAFAQAFGSGSGAVSGTAELAPNRSSSREITGITNVANTTVTWAIAGFRYATLVNRGPGIVLIGSTAGAVVFPLAVGGAENEYVGNATGMLVIGQSAVISDTLDIIEYGRS